LIFLLTFRFVLSPVAPKRDGTVEEHVFEHNCRGNQIIASNSGDRMVVQALMHFRRPTNRLDTHGSSHSTDLVQRQHVRSPEGM
jgi:hypothetical protein